MKKDEPFDVWIEGFIIMVVLSVILYLGYEALDGVLGIFAAIIAVVCFILLPYAIGLCYRLLFDK